MEKGKGVVVLGRRWVVDVTDSSTSSSTRDVLDPPGFPRASQYQVDSSLSRQKKDAESIWKAQAWQPISALQGVGKVFEPYRDSKVDLLGAKLLFIALNLGGLALKFWKLNTLGLLPTHASDWVSSLSPAPEVEYSGGDILLHSY